MGKAGVGDLVGSTTIFLVERGLLLGLPFSSSNEDKDERRCRPSLLTDSKKSLRFILRSLRAAEMAMSWAEGVPTDPNTSCWSKLLLLLLFLASSMAAKEEERGIVPVESIMAIDISGKVLVCCL